LHNDGDSQSRGNDCGYETEENCLVAGCTGRHGFLVGIEGLGAVPLIEKLSHGLLETPEVQYLFPDDSLGLTSLPHLEKQPRGLLDKLQDRYVLLAGLLGTIGELPGLEQ